MAPRTAGGSSHLLSHLLYFAALFAFSLAATPSDGGMGGGDEGGGGGTGGGPPGLKSAGRSSGIGEVLRSWLLTDATPAWMRPGGSQDLWVRERGKKTDGDGDEESHYRERLHFPTFDQVVEWAEEEEKHLVESDSDQCDAGRDFLADFDYSHYGSKDGEGRPDGDAVVLVNSHPKGAFGFSALDGSPGLRVREIRGRFRRGRLHGRALMRCRDDSILEADFVRGRLSGRLSLFSLRWRDDDVQHDDQRDSDVDYYYLKMVAAARDGAFAGPAWIAGGPEPQMVQYFEDERLSRGAFVYPDFETVIVGTFRHRLLVAGKESRIAEESCVHQGGGGGGGRCPGVKRIRFSLPDEGDDRIFRYDPPSHYRLGDDPTLEDPYESKHVQVRRVEIDFPSGKKSGRSLPGKKEEAFSAPEEEGLFAKKRISKGQILAFYSGLVVPCSVDFFALRSGPPPTQEEDDWRHSYLISLVKKANKVEMCVDVPPELGRDLTAFRSTLGHKINHSFEPNAAFVEVPAHPRYGFIMGVAATRDVEAGEQVTANYNYGKGDKAGPAWYKAALEEWEQSKEARDSPIKEEKGSRNEL